MTDRPTGRQRGAATVAAVGVVVSTAAFDPAGLRPFTTLRWPVLAIALLGALALTAPSAPWTRWPRWLRWTGAALLGWLVLATALGPDPSTAWIGHPRRHLGLAGWLVSAAGLVVGSGLDTDAARRVIGRAGAVAAAVMGAAAIVELAGVEPAGIGFPGPRVGGLYGQPAYLGAATVLVVPVALAQGNDGSVRWRWVARAGAAGATVALVASQTRGAWVGAAAAAAVGFPRWRAGGRRVALAAAGALAVLVAVAVLTPLGTRARSTFDLSTGTTAGRVAEWRVAAAAITDRWLVGSGPDGYRVAAPAHIDEDYTRRYGRREVVDRAHNGLLDVAAVAGLPGAALYGTVAVGMVSALWAARRDGRPLVVGAAAGVIGYLVQQLVLFPVAELDPLAWLLAGLVLAARAPAPAEPGPAHARVPGIVAAGAVIGALLAGLTGAADALADRRLADAEQASRAGDHPSALLAADAATRLRPDSLDTWYVAAGIAARGPTIVDLDAGLDRAEAGLRVSPADPALLDLHERLLAERATRSELPDDLARAAAASRGRLAADPANPRHHRLLGIVAAVAGDRDTAITALDRALALDPDDAAARRARAMVDGLRDGT